MRDFIILFFSLLFGHIMICDAQHLQPQLPYPDAYQLVFQDEFNGTALDWTVWESENAIKESASGQKTYRSKANAIVENGLLKLMIRKEKQKGSDWTAAFVWLRETYGPNTYYEARFINTNATGINNAFWMACKTADGGSYKNRYEIDCPENKVHVDGTVHAHLAWHDWKGISYLDGKHIAQGVVKTFAGSDFQTWGLWVGEKDFAIYYNGKMQWDGKTHPRYTDQYYTGVGKLPEWNPAEEKRAYGKFGQEDWSYFGGMNGDEMNVCFSTIPWESEGTPLSDSADNTFMGVDYLRIYKRKVELNTTLTQMIDAIIPEDSIKLKLPIDLTEEKNSYFSFRIKRALASDVRLALLTDTDTLATIRITEKNTIEIAKESSVSSTAESYPARDRISSLVPIGVEHLVVIRITGHSSDKDIISCTIIDPKKGIPEKEPFLYQNIDDQGNTSISNEWDISKKTTSSGSIKTVAFAFDNSVVSCFDFRATSNYLALVNQ